MAIFVRSFSVDVGCPLSRYVGQIATISGGCRAEVENDGNQEASVRWELELRDSDGNSTSDYGYIYVPANGRMSVVEPIFLKASYSDPGSKTGICRGLVDTDSQSTSCTFTIYSENVMPEVVRKLYERDKGLKRDVEPVTLTVINNVRNETIDVYIQEEYQSVDEAKKVFSVPPDSRVSKRIEELGVSRPTTVIVSNRSGYSQGTGWLGTQSLTVSFP